MACIVGATAERRIREYPHAVSAASIRSKVQRQVLLPSQHALEVVGVAERLRSAGGGYETVHESPGLELGVYVLVAPEPDRQQPHADDEVYVVLEGSGVLEVEGEQVAIGEGQA